jgi:hypothetical protein
MFWPFFSSGARPDLRTESNLPPAPGQLNSRNAICPVQTCLPQNVQTYGKSRRTFVSFAYVVSPIVPRGHYFWSKGSKREKTSEIKTDFLLEFENVSEPDKTLENIDCNYESPALTAELRALYVSIGHNKRKTISQTLTSGNFFENGRGGEIRTHDLLDPNQARYQPTLRPDVRVLKSCHARTELQCEIYGVDDYLT